MLGDLLNTRVTLVTSFTALSESIARAQGDGRDQGPIANVSMIEMRRREKERDGAFLKAPAHSFQHHLSAVPSFPDTKNLFCMFIKILYCCRQTGLPPNKCFTKVNSQSVLPTRKG